MLQRDCDRRTYLVVLHDVLVLQDIAATIVEHDSGADVLPATTCSQALELLEGAEAIEIAFVEADPELFGKSTLAREVTARGGRVVLLGNKAEDWTGDSIWPVLRRPFRSVDVSRLLRGDA